MGKKEALIVANYEPGAISIARARMPSIQYIHNHQPGSQTVLFLPGGSRDPQHYEGPPIVGHLATKYSVVTVGYPYQEQRPKEVVDQKPEKREDFDGAMQRAADAIELLDTLQEHTEKLRLVVKSGGTMFALKYLRKHPEISKRTVLTVLGLPFNINKPEMTEFNLSLMGLNVIQGERDQYFTPDGARKYLQRFREELGCYPNVIGVKGDHSFRGEGQDKEDWSTLPEHLPDVLQILDELEF